MRTKNLLLAALAATALASCSDDLDFVNQNTVSQDANGKMVDAGLLSLGRDNGAESRSLNSEGKFVWMPTASILNADGTVKDGEKTTTIGLCWTGVNDVPGHEAYGAREDVNENVYTNYEFYHVGWLEPNQDKPLYEDCEDALKNGAFINGFGYPVAKHDYTISKKRQTVYQNPSVLNSGSYLKNGTTATELNLGKGVFATDNASVYEGQYLAYFPYNNKFTRGPIVASMPSKYVVDKNDDKYAMTSENAFSVGLVRQYGGGNQASGLSAHTFSGWIKVNITADFNYGKKIQKVILYSETEGIVYESPLNAANLVADLKSWESNGEKFVSNNYAEGKQEKTNAVFINMTSDNGANPYWEVDYLNSIQIYVPILPQTLNDLQVILVDENDKSYTGAAQQVDVKSNGVAAVNININKAFENLYMVVDEPSLHSAFDKIQTDGSASGENNIQLLRNIDLAKDYELNFNKSITIFSKCNSELTLLSTKENATEVAVRSAASNKVLTVKVPVNIQGWECCGNDAAKLSVGGGTKCIVAFEGDIVNNGTLALGNTIDPTDENKITVNNLVNKAVKVSKLRDVIEARPFDQINANEAKLYLMGSGTTKSSISFKNLENWGDVYAFANNIDINKICWNNGAAATATNQAVLHPFAQEIKDARDGVHSSASETRKVEVSVKNSMKNYKDLAIDKKVLFTVEGTFENTNKGNNDGNAVNASKPTAKIVIDGEGYSDWTDGRLDVKATTSTNNGIIDNSGVVNFTATNLVNEGLFVDQLSGQVGGQYVKAVEGSGKFVYDKMTYETHLSKGIYVSKVKTAERLQFAMTDDVEWKSVKIIEIVGMDVAAYELNKYKGYKSASHAYTALKNIDIYINASGIKFKNATAGTSSDNVKQCIGCCVTVQKDCDLTILTTNGTNEDAYYTTLDLISKKGGVVVTENSAKTTIGRDIINDGTMTFNGALKVNHDILDGKNNAAILSTKSTLKVEHDLIVTRANTQFNAYGRYTIGNDVLVNNANYNSLSGATNNTIGRNFTMTGSANVTFAPKTTTTINGTFSCEGGTFQREGLNGGSSYRATVNCGALGATAGTTNSAWPTVMVD